MSKAVIQSNTLNNGTTLTVEANADVEIRDATTGSLATLYSDRSGTGTSNPFTSNSNGFFRVYVDSGRYDVTVTTAAGSQTFEDIITFAGAYDYDDTNGYGFLDGNVGIGTSTPTGRLDVTYTSDTDGAFVSNSSRNGRYRLSTSGVSAEGFTIARETSFGGGTFEGLLSVGSVLSVSTGAVGSATEKLKTDSSGNFLPGSDNAYSCGTASNRWSVVYAATGTINTSDERLKERHGEVPGLGFLTKLKPFSYKWKIGKNKIKVIEDGTQYVKPVIDNNGVKLKDGFYRKKFKTVLEPIKGVRTHWGFSAQQVKEVLDELGTDFAGWILNDINDKNSVQGLRYDQLISPVVQSIIEQQTQIEELKSENADLKLAIQSLGDRLEALEQAS